MKRCYLAGPMRGRPQFNFPAFFAGEHALYATGWDAVYNPARMDVEADGEATMTLTDEYVGRPVNTRRYAKRDCAILIDVLRAEDGDAIVVLPGWEQSRGASAEVAVARWVGLPMLTLEEATRGTAD